MNIISNKDTKVEEKIKEENQNLFNNKNELLNTKNDFIIHKYINFTNGFIIGLLSISILFYVLIIIPKSKVIATFKDKPLIFKNFKELCEKSFSKEYNDIFQKFNENKKEESNLLQEIKEMQDNNKNGDKNDKIGKKIKNLSECKEKKSENFFKLKEYEGSVINALLRFITGASKLKLMVNDKDIIPNLYEDYDSSSYDTLLEWIFYKSSTLNTFINNLKNNIEALSVTLQEQLVTD